MVEVRDHILFISGTIDFENAPQLLEETANTLNTEIFIIDLSLIEKADSAAISVFLTLKKQLIAEGIKLQLRNWPEKLKRLAEVYEVWDLLNT